MQQFMLLIRNKGDNKAGLSPEQHEQFLKACESYIEKLKRENKLISAQPMQRDGRRISGTPGDWREEPYNPTPEIIVGYYHIYARDLEEATAIAKANPEFAFGERAIIEVRPLKGEESTTGYVYPDSKK